MADTIYRSNYVVCPSCAHEFEHNKVNGIALINAVQGIDARKRMYCKLSLDDLERMSRDNGTIQFSAAKKVVLDNFNDFVRDINSILGFGVEAE